MKENKMGKFIAEERKKKNMTQKALADKLYVTDRAVSKWERGLSFPDILLLEKLSSILEVSVSELLNGEKLDTINKEKADDIVKDSIVRYKKDVKKHLFFKIIIGIILTIITAILILVIALTLFSKFYKGNIVFEPYPISIKEDSINTANKFMEAMKNKDIETIDTFLTKFFTNENEEIQDENIAKFNSYLEDFFNDFTIINYEYGYNHTNYGKLFTHEYTLFLNYKDQTIMHYIFLRSNETDVYIYTIGYEDDDKESMKFIENNPDWSKVEKVFNGYNLLNELNISDNPIYHETP